MIKTATKTGAVISCSYLLIGCTPGVRVLPPEKPIEIKMDVKVQQDVRVSINEDVPENVRKSLSVIGVPDKETKDTE